MNEVKSVTYRFKESDMIIDNLDKDIQSIRLTINKWIELSIGTGIDRGMYDCALCGRYSFCSSCPVVVIGKGGFSCTRTPYIKWKTHQIETHQIENYQMKFYGYYTMKTQMKTHCGTCRTLANKELMFLQSILEKLVEKRKNKEKINA